MGFLSSAMTTVDHGRKQSSNNFEFGATIYTRPRSRIDPQALSNESAKHCVAGSVRPRTLNYPQATRTLRPVSGPWKPKWVNCARPMRSCALRQRISGRRSSTAYASDRLVYRRTQGSLGNRTDVPGTHRGCGYRYRPWNLLCLQEPAHLPARSPRRQDQGVSDEDSCPPSSEGLRDP